ncbi:MAG: leucine-rich repeat domain-containing protein, partial [Eubacterium sp.]|nr:leucine-rich repeat domain-containing protein [Eubacterium sp.]
MEVKKWTALLLCIILCAGSIPCNAAAKKASGTDGNGNTWEYDVKTKTLTFSGNKGIEDYIFDGHSPEPDWYVWNTKAEHIIINDGITGIGKWAFYAFVRLKTVEIADSVTFIKNEAFASCRNLTSVKLSVNVRNIEGEAFYACERLEHLTLPDTLKTLGTFGSCSKLKEVIIPDSVT